MNKAEMLKKQAQANTMNLYLSNDMNKSESIQQPTSNNEIVQPIKEIKKENALKMLSFRIPQETIDNIDKYAYVQRMKKQDLIIMIFDSFFKDNKAQVVLKQYDTIKKGE